MGRKKRWQVYTLLSRKSAVKRTAEGRQERGVIIGKKQACVACEKVLVEKEGLKMEPGNKGQSRRVSVWNSWGSRLAAPEMRFS